MTTAKWTINTREQQDLHYPAARFNDKGCLPVWGWRCSKLLQLESKQMLGNMGLVVILLKP
jgi:hypothetical protein